MCLSVCQFLLWFLVRARRPRTSAWKGRFSEQTLVLSPAAKYMLLQLPRPERPVFQGIEPKGVSYRRECWLLTGYERTVRTPLLLTTRPSMLLAVSILATTHAGGGGGSVIAVDMIPDRLRVAERCVFLISLPVSCPSQHASRDGSR